MTKPTCVREVPDKMLEETLDTYLRYPSTWQLHSVHWNWWRQTWTIIFLRVNWEEPSA